MAELVKSAITRKNFFTLVNISLSIVQVYKNILLWLATNPVQFSVSFNQVSSVSKEKITQFFNNKKIIKNKNYYKTFGMDPHYLNSQKSFACWAISDEVAGSL